MPDLTPEKLAELRQLLDAYRAASGLAPILDAWHAVARAALAALPALLDAAAERDALAAAVERQKEGREYLRAERDALRNWSHDLQVELKGAEAQRQMLLAERDALAAAVERVRALHVAARFCGATRWVCSECCIDWPCPTIRALDESEANK